METMETNFKANKVVVSLSGGLDSTCVLLHYLARGFEVRAISFRYGQKHEIELTKVKKNIEFLQSKGLKVTHQIIDLTDCFSDSQSTLHKGNGSIPHDAYNSENQRSTVISNRNIIFSAITYGKALDWSVQTQDNVLISLGIHANDHSVYPDCRPESQEMARELFRISNWGSERVDYEAPFVNLNKADVLADGVESMQNLGFTREEMYDVLGDTHSCYDVNEEGVSCGLCGTCQERIWAFWRNGLIDPVPYAISEERMKEVALAVEENM